MTNFVHVCYHYMKLNLLSACTYIATFEEQFLSPKSTFLDHLYATFYEQPFTHSNRMKLREEFYEHFMIIPYEKPFKNKRIL